MWGGSTAQRALSGKARGVSFVSASVRMLWAASNNVEQTVA